MLEDQFLSNKSILERLVRLETKTCLEFTNLDKAVVLAREQVERDKQAAKEQVKETFATLQALNREVKELNEKIGASVNDTIAKMDKISEKFEKQRETSEAKNESLKRLVWMGAGGVLCLNWLLQYLLKW